MSEMFDKELALSILEDTFFYIKSKLNSDSRVSYSLDYDHFIRGRITLQNEMFTIDINIKQSLLGSSSIYKVGMMELNVGEGAFISIDLANPDYKLQILQHIEAKLKSNYDK